MQLIDLNKQYRELEDDIKNRIHAVLEHGQYIMGPEIAQLEDDLASYVGVSHCVTVSSGTDALMMVLMALGIGQGDEVITTPFTFIATAEVIALLGAKPVFVDIDPRTYNIDSNKIEEKITDKTRAIIPVSLFGQCPDFNKINNIAKKYNIPVIEDGAQSFGATYGGQKSCSLTVAGCTSFFPSKPLGGYGDGGACFTNDDELAQKIREIRVHGQNKKYHHSRLGVNGRLDSIQAAVLISKFKIFPGEVELRKVVADRYSILFQDAVKTPYVSEMNESVYAQYTIRVNHRENIQADLKKNGIPSAIYYPIPLHLQPAFIDYGYKKGDFPIAEKASIDVLSLPMHPYLTEEEQARVVSAVIEAIKNNS